MAARQSMTTDEVVAKTLIEEHADFLREAVALVARHLMEAEISANIGADHGEQSSERVTHRNGYRSRAWETRVGDVDLDIPRKRSGEAYFPSFLEPRRRSEQAIVACVMEAYVNGVSTRKVDRLVSQLGIANMSKDRVSAMCRGLDEQVAAFRERSLEGSYPYCGSTPSTSRSEAAATCAPRRWSSPMACTIRAAVRSSASTSARWSPVRSGSSSSGACGPGASPGCAWPSPTPTRG